MIHSSFSFGLPITATTYTVHTYVLGTILISLCLFLCECSLQNRDHYYHPSGEKTEVRGLSHLSLSPQSPGVPSDTPATVDLHLEGLSKPVCYRYLKSNASLSTLSSGTMHASKNRSCGRIF